METILVLRVSFRQARKRAALLPSPGQERHVELSPVARFSCNPASHGRIGLYGEPMQKEQYGGPKEPELSDAKKLFEWVLVEWEVEDGQVIPLAYRSLVHIIGMAPKSQR
jgi:hypothetical protein